MRGKVRSLEKHVLWFSLPLAVMGLFTWLYFLNSVPIPAIIIRLNSTQVLLGNNCQAIVGATNTYACVGADPNYARRVLSFIGFAMLVGFGFVSLVMSFGSILMPEEWANEDV